MTHPNTTYATLDDWIACETLPFSIDEPATFHAAVDTMIASLGDAVELLGFGEALHGGEDILILRNRLFERLVEAHGYSAIAIESSFPRSHIVNDYVAGRGPASYEEVQEAGFSSGFGRLAATRELVEWMRSYNAADSHAVKLHFYGSDSVTQLTGADSPAHVLHVVLDYLTSIDQASGQKYRSRIDPLLGQDAAWENPEAMMDPTQSIGLSPQANALRIETEELMVELCVRCPELVAASGQSRYLKALQLAKAARQLLNYHAEMARPSKKRMSRLLGISDAIMADNLAYMVSCERGRGKVLVFAHNSHLQRTTAEVKGEWPGDSSLWTWCPVGAHLNVMFGPRYAVIGSAVGESLANGIGQPEAGSLEARLTALAHPAVLIPTHTEQGLPASEIAALPTRSGSVKNPSYVALTPTSFTAFDWLVVLNSTSYARGGWPLERTGSEDHT
jgi:erythromycin esterase